MPSPSGLRPSGLGIYIRQIPLAHVITITYVSYTRVITSSQRPVQYYNDFMGLFLLRKPKNLEVRGINWGAARKPRLHICNFPSHFCCSRSIFTKILKQMVTNVHAECEYVFSTKKEALLSTSLSTVVLNSRD